MREHEEYGFNPTLVRLRLFHIAGTPRRSRCFNPTLVRLRPFGPPGQSRISQAFQSHAGSIEASESSPKPNGAGLPFQSHAGSIEALSAAGSICTISRFNPTLVRLRRESTYSSVQPNSRFNPTLVRLRRLARPAFVSHRKGFQSHAGSIEACGC